MKEIKIMDKKVNFDLSLLEQDNVYFNATALAKQFGKKFENFLNSKGFKEYCQVVLKNNKNMVISTKNYAPPKVGDLKYPIT